jgi:regulator of RNase E activity RraA
MSAEEATMSTCRLYPEGPVPDEELLTQLRRVPSSVASDQMERFNFARGIRRMTSPDLGITVGRAFTIRTRPGDNLVIYQAAALARPGDILVVDGGGFDDRALLGEIFYNHLIASGVGGLVVDGAIRDAAEIGAGPIPVFARGAAHPAPFKTGPGELRGAISIGGTVVRQGDVIIGDADGVAVVPFERLAEVTAGGLQLLEDEKVKMARAAAGQADTSFLATTLTIIEA